MRILHVDSSVLGERSVSRQISGEIVARLIAAHPQATVHRRDLGAMPLPHVDLENIPSPHPLAAQAGDAGPQRRDSDAVLSEFLDADVVVIGAPMYNFGVPSQLKAWIDRVIIPGVTFRRTATGPEGLVVGKRVIIAAARGNFYGQGAPAASFEHMESHLRTAFSFIGIATPEIIVAEGVSASPDQRASAIQGAQAAIREMPLA